MNPDPCLRILKSNRALQCSVRHSQEALAREPEIRSEKKKEMVVKREGDFYSEKWLLEKLNVPPQPSEIGCLSKPNQLSNPLPKLKPQPLIAKGACGRDKGIRGAAPAVQAVPWLPWVNDACIFQ